MDRIRGSQRQDPPRTSALALVALFVSALAGCLSDNDLRPSSDRPWAGIVAVEVERADAITAAEVDGVPVPLARSPAWVIYLDTTALADGPHSLRLEADAFGRSVALTRTFSVANAPTSVPAARFVPWELLPRTPGAGTSGEVVRAGATAADLDDDGDLDLFAWAEEVGRVVVMEGRLATPVGPELRGIIAAAAGDLDGDGLVDLVAGGRELHFLRNLGGARFEAVPLPLERWMGAPPYRIHGVGLADFDLDGRLDVLVARMACDGAVPSLALRNDGRWRFSEVGSATGLDHPLSATFAVAVDDLGEGLGQHAWPLVEACQPPAVLAYTRLVPGADLPAAEVPLRAGVPTTYGSMGTAYLDADGDGHLDLFHSMSTRQLLLRGPEFVDDVAFAFGLEAMPDPSLVEHNQWGAGPVDVDLDGVDELIVSQSELPPRIGAAGLAPRLQLFHRRGAGPFREVGRPLGLAGGRGCLAVQACDLDADGDPDLVAACRDGVEVFRNESSASGRGRTLLLRGTVSNAAGFGARVHAEGAEARLVRGTGQPFMVAEAAPSVRAPDGTRLRVAWPSGLVQEVVSGPARVLVVEEPRVVALSAGEVAPGGGDVAVEVRPGLVGSSAAQVSLSGGAWREPPARGADGVVRGLVATPTTPGSIRVEVSIDGRPLAVRPRIVVR